MSRFARPVDAACAPGSLFVSAAFALEEQHPQLYRVWLECLRDDRPTLVAQRLGLRYSVVTSYRTRARTFILERMAPELARRAGCTTEELLRQKPLRLHKAIERAIRDEWERSIALGHYHEVLDADERWAEIWRDWPKILARVADALSHRLTEQRLLRAKWAREGRLQLFRLQ